MYGLDVLNVRLCVCVSILHCKQSNWIWPKERMNFASDGNILINGNNCVFVVFHAQQANRVWHVSHHFNWNWNRIWKTCSFNELTLGVGRVCTIWLLFVVFAATSVDFIWNNIQATNQFRCVTCNGAIEMNQIICAWQFMNCWHCHFTFSIGCDCWLWRSICFMTSKILSNRIFWSVLVL